MSFTYNADSSLKFEGIKVNGLWMDGWICKRCRGHWIDEVQDCPNCSGQEYGPFDLLGIIGKISKENESDPI